MFLVTESLSLVASSKISFGCSQLEENSDIFHLSHIYFSFTI